MINARVCFPYSDSNQDHGCHGLLRSLEDMLNDTFFIFLFFCLCVNKYPFSQSRVIWALSGQFLRYLQCIFPVVLVQTGCLLFGSSSIFSKLTFRCLKFKCVICLLPRLIKFYYDFSAWFLSLFSH